MSGTGAPGGDMTEVDRTEAFVKLLSQHQRRIGSYILTLVPHWADAEEILQETNVVLWREFHRFELGTNFAAWAYKIAYHQVLNFRKRKHRDKLQFSDAFLEAVATETATVADNLESRYRVMTDCIAKLSERHRAILNERYRSGADIARVAETVGRSVAASYRALSRIRRTLQECVQRTLAAEARA